MIRAKPPLRAVLMLALAALLLGLAVFVSSGRSRAYSPAADDVARTVVCQCGCNLVLYNCNHIGCPGKEAMYNSIETQLKQGIPPQVIVASFVTEYGETVLAAPTKQGFNLTAWLLPFLALLAGAGVIYLALRTWVGAAVPVSIPFGPQGRKDDSEYRRRVEEDLKRLGGEG
ncbi:MAG: cytochrome c-type biogenesis protein CcmH [Chloroflexi bacterium]|nr:cytochrome c-type biogenesis protein CcmH [Chloroflexota bacterium]